MSVLIKGIKMPKNCTICRFCAPEADPENGEMCMATGKYVPPCSTERLEECPLVEVPTPHGRLIDEKQIPYVDLNADMPQSKVRVWTTFKDKIDRLPTIIEAEEGEAHEQN